MHHRPKLEDVASAAGVSRATAWRALNQPERVSRATAEKVRHAVHSTGYVPDVVARTFRKTENALISLILPTVTYGFARAMREIGTAAGRAGFELLLGVTEYDRDSEYRLVQSMLGRRVPAMILTGADQLPETRGILRTAGIPIVQLWEVDGDPIEMMVGFSNFQAGRAAARYLADRGCRRIGAIYLPSRSRSRRRLEGFRAGLREAALDQAVPIEAHVPDRPHGVREAMEAVHAIARDVDGLFLNGDQLVLEALQWCRSAGCRVPDDLALLGWGDRDFARFADPPISTIRVPEAEIGSKAAELIARRLNGERVEERKFDLGVTIISRGTA